MTFSAIGETKTVDVKACDEFIDDFGTWGGLFLTNSEDAYSFYGLGVDVFGRPRAERLTTPQATYEVVGNVATDIYQITLVSLLGSSAAETLPLFMCPGPEAGRTCITTQPTSLSVVLPRRAPLDITTTSLATGRSGVAYNLSIMTEGGLNPITLSLSSGRLPVGLDLSTGGLIAGTPSEAGDFPITVAATDAGGARVTRDLILTIAGPQLELTLAALQDATVGQRYETVLGARGGIEPRTFTIASGALPDGLGLSTSGTLAGTPTSIGTFDVTIRVTDATTGSGAPFFAERAYRLVVGGSALGLSPASLSAGRVGEGYRVTLTASGGVPTYRFALGAGALPSGLTLSTDGILQGTPREGGSFSLTVNVTDSATGAGPQQTSRVYDLVIAAPVIEVSSGSAGTATVGTPYRLVLSATGGIAPYQFELTAGTLPFGITLSAEGVVSGTPTAGGNFSFSVTARDAAGGDGPYTGTRSYTLIAQQPTLSLTPDTLPDGSIGAVYEAQLTPSGGTSPYSVDLTSGTLPPGVSLSPGGRLSGTPSARGRFTFTVRAQDSSTGSGPFSISKSYTVDVAGPTILISSSAPPAQLYSPYRATIGVSGGEAPYTFALQSGALPPGLSLASDGAVSGTPTAPGSYTFGVQVRDGSPPSAGGPFNGAGSVTIVVGSPTIALLPATFSAVRLVPFTAQIGPASGGQAPYLYTLASGQLPIGISLSAEGELSGTPLQAGTYTFAVTVRDGSGSPGPYTAGQTFVMTVAEPPIAAIPTVSEWTMILLLLILASGAAFYLNRRTVR